MFMQAEINDQSSKSSTPASNSPRPVTPIIINAHRINEGQLPQLVAKDAASDSRTRRTPRWEQVVRTPGQRDLKFDADRLR